MASTIALRRRIKTARNISKTTRAFQMIAASRLKKAQEATLAGRPYVEKLSKLSKSIQRSLEKDQLHPYMISEKNTGKTLVIAVSPDKGLCGGLVTNLVREVLNRKTENYEFIIVGKKIESTIARLGKPVLATFSFGTTLPPFDAVYPISTLIDEQYLQKKVDSVIILTTHFDSLFTQKPQITKLLPIVRDEDDKNKNDLELFEPGASALLPSLLRHSIEMVLYQHLLESYLSEQASRMIAMQNATDNAKDMIDVLTLEYNKARQQKITGEILDITSSTSAAYA